MASDEASSMPAHDAPASSSTTSTAAAPLRPPSPAPINDDTTTANTTASPTVTPSDSAAAAITSALTVATKNTATTTSTLPDSHLCASSPKAVPPKPQTTVVASAAANEPNGDAGSSSSLAMSYNQQPGGAARPPGSYPTPGTNYGSPGMLHGSFPYGTPSTQAPAEAYRASPGTPVSLPSVKTFDPLSQQLQHQHQQPPPPQQLASSHGAPQQPMPQSMPIPHATTMPGVPYYSHMSMAPNPYSLPSDATGMRYAIPPHADPRFTSSPRGPKKDIKRRTKTGCLTCRKRRIKCDEGQPTCNNCKKSKRECLGYDPVFRQAGHSNIQPAVENKSPDSTPATSSSSVPPSAPLTPSHPYSQQEQKQHSFAPALYRPAVRATAPKPYDSPNPSPSSARPPESYEYPQAIDPALQPLPTLPSSMPNPTPGTGLRSTAPPDYQHVRARKMKIDDVIALLGPAPQVQPVALTDDLFREIVRVYHEVYVYGLTNFFETPWFLHKDAQGNLSFPNDQNVINIFTSFLRVIEKIQTNDRPGMISSGVLEARLTWGLATLPYVLCPQGTNSLNTVLPHPADAVETRNRVHVIDTLLSGDHLSSNPLAPPLQDAQVQRTREYQFWRVLADYLCLQDEPNVSKAAQREEMLGRLRDLLDGRENRDLIYSIAIARELSPRHPPGYEQTIPQHIDESESKHKLFVASKFIRQEAQVTGGTTNVVRRLSEIAIQAFIQPGVSVAKTTPAV